MGRVFHGSATTTHAIRAAIQRSLGQQSFVWKRREAQASVSALSETYGINPKTVLKWKKRACVEDRKTGPIPGRAYGRLLRFLRTWHLVVLLWCDDALLLEWFGILVSAPG